MSQDVISVRASPAADSHGNPQCYAALKSPPSTFFTRCRMESWLASYGCSLLGISSIAGTGCTTHTWCSGYRARACSCPWQRTAYQGNAGEQVEAWGRYIKLERVVGQNGHPGCTRTGLRTANIKTRRSGACLGVVVDEVADEVGDVLVDKQDGYVLALGVVLEGVLHLPHCRLCTRKQCMELLWDWQLCSPRST